MLFQLVDTIIAQRLDIVNRNVSPILATILMPIVLVSLAQEKAVASLLEAKKIPRSTLTINITHADETMFYAPEETTIRIIARFSCSQSIDALKMPKTIKIAIAACLKGTR